MKNKFNRDLWNHNLISTKLVKTWIFLFVAVEVKVIGVKCKFNNYSEESQVLLELDLSFAVYFLICSNIKGRNSMWHIFILVFIIIITIWKETLTKNDTLCVYQGCKTFIYLEIVLLVVFKLYQSDNLFFNIKNKL